MPVPFRVFDQDFPAVDLGGWSEDGDIDIPGSLTVAGDITVGGTIHGGGAGGGVIVAQDYITSGNLTPQAAVTMAPLTGGPTLRIAAAAGDWVELAPSFEYQPSGSYLDFCVLVGGVPVRYASTGTATPAPEGDPAVYAQPGTFRCAGPLFAFRVTASDLDAGGVTFAIATVGNGSGTLFASTSYPFRWRAVNYGQVTGG